MDGMVVEVDPRESTWTARAIYQYHPNPDVKLPPVISYIRTERVDAAGRSVFVPTVEPNIDS
jgi:hypothetical protein